MFGGENDLRALPRPAEGLVLFINNADISIFIEQPPNENN